METKIYAVIDTNVIVSALFSISGQSNPATIIRKVVDGTITPIYNEEILAEYKEVLGRDKFPFRKMGKSLANRRGCTENNSEESFEISLVIIFSFRLLRHPRQSSSA